MELLHAVILGAMQGLMEWLPISSRGNLVIMMNTFMGISVTEALKISIFLHIGTLLSAIVYYRKEIKKILTGGNKKLLKNLIRTTIISVALAGILYYAVKEVSSALGSIFLALIGISLIITGTLQWKVKKKGIKDDVNKNDSIVTGVAQGLAVIPGLSRSGMTTTTLLLKNVTPKEALKYSFIASIPFILIGELGLGLLEGFQFGMEAVIGLGVAFITGLASIKALTKLAERVNFGKFTIILGVLALVPALLL